MNLHEIGLVILLAVTFILLFVSTKRYRGVIASLRKENSGLRETLASSGKVAPPPVVEEEDEEEDDPELKVGSEVEIDLEGWRVRGVIESIASAGTNPSGKGHNQPGFSFRAHGDKNTLWLAYGYDMVLLDEEDEEDETKGDTSPGGEPAESRVNTSPGGDPSEAAGS